MVSLYKIVAFKIVALKILVLLRIVAFNAFVILFMNMDNANRHIEE